MGIRVHPIVRARLAQAAVRNRRKHCRTNHCAVTIQGRQQRARGLARARPKRRRLRTGYPRRKTKHETNRTHHLKTSEEALQDSPPRYHSGVSARFTCLSDTRCHSSMVFLQSMQYLPDNGLRHGWQALNDTLERTQHSTSLAPAPCCFLDLESSASKSEPADAQSFFSTAHAGRFITPIARNCLPSSSTSVASFDPVLSFRRCSARALRAVVIAGSCHR